MNIDLRETQDIIDSAKEQVYLQGKTHTGTRAKPRRGQVFNCHLGVGVGSEFQKRRPCVVLSNTVSNINTSIAVVAPITHTQKAYPTFVPFADKLDGNGVVVLSGYVDLSGMRAISSFRFAGLVCAFDKSEMKQVDEAIARHLDLMHHYNALVKAAEDREKYVDVLNGVLRELRDMTGTKNNQDLIMAVQQLLQKSREAAD